MQQAAKFRILRLVTPLLIAVGFIAKQVYWVLLGWWLYPLLDRKWTRELVNDIEANLPSLVSSQSSIRVVHADWPTVEISYDNLLFTIVRWQDETIVKVAPRHAPEESYAIGPLIAAIEHRHYSERDVVNDLPDVEKLLVSVLPALNAAFSEQQYPLIRQRL